MKKEVNSLENLSVISFMNIRKFPPLIKSFFSPKKEELYRCQYSSESEFLKGIERYITFYHEKRTHSFIYTLHPQNAAEETFYHTEKE